MPSIKNSVVEMVQAIKKGEISSEELVKSYIEQIKKKEKDVQAFQFFDEELALTQAKKLDLLHQAGQHGDLHVALLDVKHLVFLLGQ